MGGCRGGVLGFGWVQGWAVRVWVGAEDGIGEVDVGCGGDVGGSEEGRLEGGVGGASACV